MNCPHCETEIDEHEANRCLDAWVANKVIGIYVRISADAGGSFLPLMTTEKIGSFYTGGEGRKEVPILNYSTDIAAAWRIVEEKGYSIWCAGGPDEWTWGAGYWDWEDGKKDLLVYAFGITSAEERLSPMCSTPPLAICRAALKAVYVGEG